MREEKKMEPIQKIINRTTIKIRWTRMTALLLMMVLIAGCSSSDGKESRDSSVKEGYSFETNGSVIFINEKAEPVLDKLGDSLNYFEAPSCANEGIDKTYTYSSFAITTYQEDDVDYIASIVLKDDTISTKEGISLYSTREQMEEAYGTDYEETNGMYTYQKGHMKLRFLVQQGLVTSIEYAKVWA